MQRRPPWLWPLAAAVLLTFVLYVFCLGISTGHIQALGNQSSDLYDTMSSPSSNFKFLALGAIIQEYRVGEVNIVQNWRNSDQYKIHNDAYFGETIGRVANRISNATIKELNGRGYNLSANNGPHALHGGVMGFGKRVFDGPVAVERHGRSAVQYKYLSKDGEEGYPGTVELRVWYSSRNERHAGTGAAITVLETEYEAELVGDEDVEETAVAVTNHSYFTLANSSSIEGTEVTLSTNMHQVIDDTSIPTGAIEPYPGIEANKPFTLGPTEPDIDHCFILNLDPKSIPVDTRSLPLRRLGSFFHPATQIHLEVHSTEPAFQFYTGKYIDAPAVDGQPARGPRSGFCVEPSRYVNAVNDERWKGMVVLRRGQTFGSRFEYRAWRDTKD